MDAFDDYLEGMSWEAAQEEHHALRNRKWLERCPERPGGTLIDIFGTSHAKPLDKSNTCQICQRPVSVLKFAPHLEGCMGKGRSRGRRSKLESPASFLSSSFPSAPSSPYPPRVRANTPRGL